MRRKPVAGRFGEHATVIRRLSKKARPVGMIKDEKPPSSAPPEATSLFSIVATTATVFLTFCSLIGYAFLVKYYELFGVRYSDLMISSEHLFLRGFDLLRLNYWMLLLFSISLISVIVIFLVAHSHTRQRVPILISASLGGLCSAVVAISICSPLAKSYAARDMFSSTTALRQLFCLESDSKEVKAFLNQASKANQKLLILAKSSNQLILFGEPRIVSENPRVRVATVELTDGDVTQTAVANIGSIGNDGTFSCY
jgi:hypothetical protein